MWSSDETCALAVADAQSISKVIRKRWSWVDFISSTLRFARLKVKEFGWNRENVEGFLLNPRHPSSRSECR